MQKLNTLKRKLNILKYPKKDAKVILVLVPFSDVVNGGHLSISSIATAFRQHRKLHGHEVILSYLYLTNRNNSVKFTKFSSSEFIQDLRTVFSHFKNFESLEIHIPESYIRFIVTELKESWPRSFIEKLQSAKTLTFNILNQNDEYMDDISYIQWLRERFNARFTMTVAHQRYCSEENRRFYKMPLHHLSAWLNNGKYEKKKFKEKQNIILLSPDPFRENIGIEKPEFIAQLQKQFPDYEVIEIKNFTYEEYKKLVSDSKFMITFGEGLDGYFIEEAFFGGIPFAVYNEVFFTPNYKSLPTVYDSLGSLIENIVTHIQKLDSEAEYLKTNAEILLEIEKEYSYCLFEQRVKSYLSKKYDLP